jgi:hypothetical protein
MADVMAIQHISRLPAAIVAAIVDACDKGYSDEALEFTKALTTGEMLERDHPALVLRNWIANTRGSGSGSVLRERFKKTTSALQAFIEQRPLTKLYLRKMPLSVARHINDP